MGFDTRGSVQGMPPYACSKNENAPKAVRFLLNEK